VRILAASPQPVHRTRGNTCMVAARPESCRVLQYLDGYEPRGYFRPGDGKRQASLLVWGLRFGGH
jgi:hypothetical protein